MLSVYRSCSSEMIIGKTADPYVLILEKQYIVCGIKLDLK
jgi:hypothetical protein